jgi:hypothetical protein
VKLSINEEGVSNVEHEKKLHILNGQVMYNEFKQKDYLKGELMIPFNEAMCFGDVLESLFSHEFNKLRANVHHVAEAQYSEITLRPLETLFNDEFSHIELWFDSDMFCQINVLTILGLLDKSEYTGKIDLHIVDGQSEPVDNFSLNADGYYEMYKQVLIHKQMPSKVYPGILKQGIELYLTYLNKDSELMEYIQRNIHMPENTLVKLLLKNFRTYGLGDTQYLELIRSCK